VFGRLAGYEDAERLRRDAAMRWVVGRKSASGFAASASQMGRGARARDGQALRQDRPARAMSALSKSDGRTAWQGPVAALPMRAAELDVPGVYHSEANDLAAPTPNL
jgi:hypothetical protein